jgi:DNA-binding sugar fermentation-stimulating protein
VADAGVEVLVYGCEMSPAAIRITRSMTWKRVVGR